MLRKLLNNIKWLWEPTKEPTVQELRQQRFFDVIYDKRFNHLEHVYQALLSGNISVRDEEIMSAYYRFSDNIQTNTFAAAELELVTISVICYYHPDLTEILLRRPLLYIVWSIGDEFPSCHVIEFVKQRILENPKSYGGWPPEPGMKWLRETLPAQTDLIERVWQSVIAENNKGLE